MIPIRTDYRMTRTPWVNYALIAANVLIFLMGFNLLSKPGYARTAAYMLQPDAPQLYQFFTSVFLHAGWEHLLGNMVFLWVFGNALNDKFGHVGYLAFYLAGGVLAGVGYLLLSGNAPVLGASGAIAAVSGAYLVLLPRARVTVLVIFWFITYFEVSSLFFILIHVAMDMFFTLSGFTGVAAGSGVAYAAHAAGYVFGIASAAALLATNVLPRDAFDLLNLIRNARRRGRYRRMVAKGYDAFDPAGLRKPGRPASRWVKAQAVESPASDGSRREETLRAEIGDACATHDLAHATAGYLQLVQISENAVLPKQQQLDVANQLMADNQHAAAADAYERFIKHYQNYEHLADIYLMLGLLYGRYLDQYDRSQRLLTQAISLLSDPKKIELAENDLRKIQGRST